ncbi:MAG: ubiquinone biosynthesis protein [Actinomycetota bacterium]|jgi:ubiquinone biosynthesis protein|nr:ubiquinone biosynthesis protein [Actinomycetota bacterium]
MLDRLPELLAEAEVRAEGIIKSSPLDRRSAVRLARLAAIAAPELVPVLRTRGRDAQAIVPVLARLALRGGPTYVKLGQLVSSTRGLAPAWIADAFAGCRDAVPPAPADAIAKVLHESGVTDHLRSWKRTPMASASVAQVHEAVLLDGTEVVVKVRRPGIVGVVSADAAYLLPILRIVEGRDERLRVANLHGTLELMLRLFAQEVDLRLEAASIVQMTGAFERAAVDVEIPKPIDGLVTKRVLTMTRIDGVSAGADGEVVGAFGHHAADLVRLAITGVLETTLVDGLFHGDLHLGNVMITPSGLALIDFGIVGRLTVQQRTALLSLLQAAVTEDRDGALRALQAFGALPADVDADDFLAKLPPPLTRDQRHAVGRDAMQERFATLIRALSASGFRVPPELTLFAKNLVYLGDAINRHAPDLDLEAELGGTVTTILKRLSSTPS